MAAQFYKINYKSDFVLTINSDAGWAVPFCIKFWTGMPSHGYFAGFDGENYVNCRVGETPTQLLVMFDDHHMPIGQLRMQIAYHTTIEEFPDRKFDEVTNPTNVTVDIDGTEYQVMLDFTGETGAEIDFSMPSSGVMSVNGKIGYVTLNAEDVGAQPTIEDLATIRSGAAAGATAVQPNEMTAALATKQDTISDLSEIRRDSALGATAVRPSELQQALATKQDTISDLSTIRSGAAAGATAVQPAALQEGLAGKQDTISDLATIRSGAAAGATAVQPATLQEGLAGKQDTISDLATIRSGAAAGATAVQPATLQEGLAGKQDTISDLSTIRSGAAAGATAVQPAALTPIENDIDAIEGKIPSAASASNQLADKAFVNSALSDKADTSDIPTALSQLSQDSTHRVVTDSEKSTWNGKQNAIDDLATIRSGAAAGATAVQPAAMNTALAAKQDTLTFDNTPTANSSNPVKSSGIKTALDAKQSTISTVNVTVDNNTGTPSGSASVSGSTLSLSFQNLKGATGATGATGPQGPQGERGLPGESGVTGDVSGFTVIQTIDPSATYGATDIAGAATVQATNAELTELAGGLNTYAVRFGLDGADSDGVERNLVGLIKYHTYRLVLNKVWSFPSLSTSTAVFSVEGWKNGSMTFHPVNYSYSQRTSIRTFYDIKIADDYDFLRVFIRGASGDSVKMSLYDITGCTLMGVSDLILNKDYFNFEAYYNGNNYGGLSDGKSLCGKDFISVMPGEVILVDNPSSLKIGYQTYTIDRTEIARTWFGNVTSITIPSNCYYIRFMIRRSNESSLTISNIGDLYCVLRKENAEIKTLVQDVARIDGEVGETVQQTTQVALSTAWISNRAVSLYSGGIITTSNGNAASYFVPIPSGAGGCTMTYTRNITTAATPTIGMNFYDSSKTLISGSSVAAVGGGESLGYQTDTCVVPQNAAFARFTMPLDDISNFSASVEVIENVYSDGLGKMVFVNTEEISKTVWTDNLKGLSTEWENGWIRASNGELVASASGPKRKRINNADYERVVLHSAYPDENPAAIAFYSDTPSTSSLISCVSAFAGIHDYSAQVPDGCKYIYVAFDSRNISFNDVVFNCEKGIVGKAKSTDEEIDRIHALSEFQQFMLQNPLIDHLYVNTAGNSSAYIPAQSVFDIAVAAQLGFKYIELNVHSTSDGKMICLHGSSGKFGNEVADLNGEFTYQNTAINSVTYQWVVDNLRYVSSEAKYQTPLPELETLLKECKRHNMSVLLTYGDSAAALAKKYFGDNWIANFSTGTPSRPTGFSGLVTCYSGLTDKDEIIAQAKSVGVPYIHSINTSAFSTMLSNGTLANIIGSLHEIGALVSIAGIYQTGAQMLEFYRAGGDISASGYELPPFYDGDTVIRSNSDWSNFAKGGGTVSNGILTVPDQGLVYPTAGTPTVTFGKTQLRMRFNGTLYLQSWMNSLTGSMLKVNYTSDGSEEIIINTYNVNHDSTPYLKAIGEVKIYAIELIASEIFDV